MTSTSRPPASDPRELASNSAEQLNVYLRLACAPVIPNRRAIIERDDGDFESALDAEITRAEGELAKVRANSSEWFSQARELLENVSEEDRLKLIPGDEILKYVFRKYGFHFNKRKDGPRLASLVQAGGIPEEIRQLLTDLTGGIA